MGKNENQYRVLFMILEDGYLKIDTIHQGDCLELMPFIKDKSIDLILSDLPYGTTACKWDQVIPFEPLWKEYKRLIKDRGAIVLTASQPFTSALVMSNTQMFRYDMVWIKTKASNFQHAREMPMKRHENVLVFYKHLPAYNLNLIPLDKPIRSSRKNKGANLMPGLITDSGNYSQTETGFNFSDIYFPNPSGPGHLHPTQKPVALFEYLIKTYTNEGDTVLDNCAGSGTTAIAALNCNRHYILIEKEPNYVEIARARVAALPARLDRWI
jgi:site-specific DNA-methyltransferase (adenine-specific)